MHCSFLDNKSSFRIVSEQTPGNTPDIFGDVNCQEHRSTKIKNKTWETEHKASRIILEVKEIQPENKRRKIKKKNKKKGASLQRAIRPTHRGGARAQAQGLGWGEDLH